MSYKSIGWSETHDHKAQCTYMNERRHIFIIRQIGSYSWISISIRVPHYTCGQIISEGQSDIDCFNRTEVILSE